MACVLDMVLAGTETTAIAIQWAILLMVKHQSVQGEHAGRATVLSQGAAGRPLPPEGRVPPGPGDPGSPGHGCPPSARRQGAGGAGPRAGSQQAAPDGGPAITALHQRRAARGAAVHLRAAPHVPQPHHRHPAEWLPIPQGGAAPHAQPWIRPGHHSSQGAGNPGVLDAGLPREAGEGVQDPQSSVLIPWPEGHPPTFLPSTVSPPPVCPTPPHPTCCGAHRART